MTLRAGLLGLGMMGRNHARVMASLDGVDLVAVADPMGDPNRLAGGRAVLTSLDHLLDQHLDYCVVAVPTACHEEVGLALADAGVAALIEKPLAASVLAAQRVAMAFESRGIVAAVGHIERYNPALRSLRDRLSNSQLGAIFQVVTRRQGPFPSRISDVGVVLDLATHDLDLTAWVQERPFAAVTARTAFRSGRPNEDLVAVLGVLADGTITSHLVNWLSPMKERVTVVTGERGAFIADTLSADLTFHANGTLPTTWDPISTFRGVSEGDVIRYAFSKPEPLVTEHEAFRDAVLGKDGDIVTLHDALDAVVVAAAVLESSKSGQTVTLRQTSRLP